MTFALPRLYPILDSSMIPADKRAAWLDRLGRSLTDAGIRLIEYRNKPGTDAEVLTDARILRAALPIGQVRLTLDDRVDVALAAGCDGVHVDAGDLPPADARRLLGADAIVGTSATSEALLCEALESAVNYISFGPIFPTTTKQTKIQPIGLEGVRRFRELAGPQAILVAAAGITLETAPAILAAGASSVAVAAAIFQAADPASEFKRWMDLIG
jgi:thiamine-phosphate pyrophosphorylase